MFDNLTYGHLIVVLLAALFILGPERLPEAASWLARAIRQAREFAAGARDQLHRELGDNLEELRQPLNELRQPLAELRTYDPRRALIQALTSETAEPTAHRSPPRTSPSQLLKPDELPPIDPDAT
jgi:sec-independent protein translocase protein TatB